MTYLRNFGICLAMSILLVAVLVGLVALINLVESVAGVVGLLIFSVVIFSALAAAAMSLEVRN